MFNNVENGDVIWCVAAAVIRKIKQLKTTRFLWKVQKMLHLIFRFLRIINEFDGTLNVQFQQDIQVMKWLVEHSIQWKTHVEFSTFTWLCQDAKLFFGSIKGEGHLKVERQCHPGTTFSIVVFASLTSLGSPSFKVTYLRKSIFKYHNWYWTLKPYLHCGLKYVNFRDFQFLLCRTKSTVWTMGDMMPHLRFTWYLSSERCTLKVSSLDR